MKIVISHDSCFAQQPCCIAGTIDSFSYGEKTFSYKIFSLFLLCNMAAVQNLYMYLGNYMKIHVFLVLTVIVANSVGTDLELTNQNQSCSSASAGLNFMAHTAGA